MLNDHFFPSKIQIFYDKNVDIVIQNIFFFKIMHINVNIKFRH